MRVRYVCNFQPKLFEEILIDNAVAVPEVGTTVEFRYVARPGHKVKEISLRVDHVKWIMEGDTTQSSTGMLAFHTVSESAIVYLGYA